MQCRSLVRASKSTSEFLVRRRNSDDDDDDDEDGEDGNDDHNDDDVDEDLFCVLPLYTKRTLIIDCEVQRSSLSVHFKHTHTNRALLLNNLAACFSFSVLTIFRSPIRVLGHLALHHPELAQQKTGRWVASSLSVPLSSSSYNR